MGYLLSMSPISRDSFQGGTLWWFWISAAGSSCRWRSWVRPAGFRWRRQLQVCSRSSELHAARLAAYGRWHVSMATTFVERTEEVALEAREYAMLDGTDFRQY